MYRQNSVEKKDAKKKKQVAAGLVSEVFPTVSDIVIRMKYIHDAATPIIMDRTVNFFPESYAYFHMDCLVKNCEKGGYDLTKIVHDLVKKRKKAAKGELQCDGKNDGIPKNHASIEYEIAVTYRKKSNGKRPK